MNAMDGSNRRSRGPEILCNTNIYGIAKFCIPLLIAQAIARRLGLGKPQSWSVEEATEEWEYIHAAY